MAWTTTVNAANLILSTIAVYLLIKRFVQIKNLPESVWKYVPLLGAFTTFLISVAFFRILFTGVPTMFEMSAKVTGLLVYIVVSSVIGLRRRQDDS